MAFEELKHRQSTAWSSAPFELIADSIAEVHELVIATLEPRPNMARLDAACGTGELAFRPAAAGATVTGLDFAASLVDTARRAAAARGLDIRFDVGDAEAMPHGDGAFAVVSSISGCMFAPDHAAVACELARVAQPGGRLALAAWTPDSTVADLFRLLALRAAAARRSAEPVRLGRREVRCDAARRRLRALLRAPRDHAARGVGRGGLGPLLVRARPAQGSRRLARRRRSRSCARHGSCGRRGCAKAPRSSTGTRTS